ncbi:MAG: hypothetical protein GQE15_05375 [Archangiaceae bacterium]|nr:hypothetical protein [Archangiaceae bacterium]
MDALRAKLNDEKAVNELAALCLEVWLDKTVQQLAPVDVVTSITRQVIDGWLDSPTAVAALSRSVDLVVNELNANHKPLKDVVARDVRAALKDVVGRPFSPDRKLVLTIIDREPTRDLVRQLLLDFVLEFGRKASAPVAGVAKGLGTFAKLAGDAVKSRTGTLGSLVGAVGSEVERQMEKRAVEFVDAALSGVFGQLADAVSDPRRATEAAELRVAMMDGVLELTLPQLARELANADVPGGAEVLRGGLKRWLASAASDDEIKRITEFVAKDLGARKLRDVLDELGLLAVVKARGAEQLALRIREVVGSEAFSAWAAS